MLYSGCRDPFGEDIERIALDPRRTTEFDFPALPGNTRLRRRFRFLHLLDVSWGCAERVRVRIFVEFRRSVANSIHPRRSRNRRR
ncbi:hypothetical protein [Amycolatopsis sp. NPDC050768]|uniref:hypothetical protein n=1 Tax=Amycolatopsis sp. NPDC050768 TaxID=3154839 RepID=UPI0033DFCF89